MAAETEASGRKTFRLDSDVVSFLSENSNRYSTENAAVNGLLRELKTARGKIAQHEIFQNAEKQKTTDALALAQQWKEKHEAKQVELQKLQDALALLGKFLLPQTS
jgi:hypothetical protein